MKEFEKKYASILKPQQQKQTNGDKTAELVKSGGVLV